MDVTWTKTGSGTTDFVVKSSTDGGLTWKEETTDEKQPTTQNGTDYAFEDDTKDDTQSVMYALFATDDDQTSADAVTASAVPIPLLAPINLRANAYWNTPTEPVVQLFWMNPSTAAESFTIDYPTGITVTDLYSIDGVNWSCLVSAGLQNGQQPNFTITAHAGSTTTASSTVQGDLTDVTSFTDGFGRQTAQSGEPLGDRWIQPLDENGPIDAPPSVENGEVCVTSHAWTEEYLQASSGGDLITTAVDGVLATDFCAVDVRVLMPERRVL